MDQTCTEIKKKRQRERRKLRNKEKEKDRKPECSNVCKTECVCGRVA